MPGEDTVNGDGVGYGKPPKNGQFKKGQSGNPRGRPKKRAITLPYDAVFSAQITIKEDSELKQVTVEEALLLKFKKDALIGGARATSDLRKLLALMPRINRSTKPERYYVDTIEFNSVEPGISVLGAAFKHDRYSPQCRLLLEPWIVQLALSRLGDRQLSVEDQRQVYAHTRTPHKVDWPDWWVIKRG